jgi:hypothetical protein
MILAVAYSSTTARLRKGLLVYALLNAVLYFILVMIGAFVPIKFLISFEFLLLVAAPGIVVLFAISFMRYARQKQQVDLIYLGTWLLLGLVILAYFIYFTSGNTASLWARGIWFSENDVLHIGLILWMLYITSLLAPRVKDRSVTV